jgi:hypothetical protein
MTWKRKVAITEYQDFFSRLERWGFDMVFIS